MNINLLFIYKRQGIYKVPLGFNGSSSIRKLSAPCFQWDFFNKKTGSEQMKVVSDLFTQHFSFDLCNILNINGLFGKDTLLESVHTSVQSRVRVAVGASSVT